MVERIAADDAFWNTVLPKLRRFYLGSMLPELASPRHPSGQPVREFVDLEERDRTSAGCNSTSLHGVALDRRVLYFVDIVYVRKRSIRECNYDNTAARALYGGDVGSLITLCAYAQQGYAFGRVGLCAYVRTYVRIYIYIYMSTKKQAV